MTPEQFRQIEELYYAARALSSEERAALLVRAGPEVRREVESLLAQPTGDGLLDRTVIQADAQLLENSAVTALTAGTCLGPYRIESKLGEGGMGEVYRAVDTRLGRAVAIKVAHSQFSERFEREARAISSLNHPNICTLHDIGPNYLVMELVDGETIAARLKKGPLSIDMALRYSSQIAAALAEAHEKGIIHRDLKPGNIMIAKNGVKVLDFGLAKSEQDETVTASHMVMGTAAYIAPEQWKGQPADARSDIYSFGCVLYEMLAGERVTPERRRIASRSLERIVSRCLEQDPARRWQSAAELERELGAKTDAARRWKATVPRQKESKAIDSLAVLPFTNISGDSEMEYLSEGIADSLANSFSEIKKLRVAPRSLAFRYRGKEVDPQSAGRDLGVRAVLSGRVLLRGDILLVGAELLDITKVSQIWGAQYRRKFEDILAVQEEIAGEISGKLRLQLSAEEKKRLAKRPAQDKETYQLYLKALYFFNQWSEENLKRAVEYSRQAIDRDPACALAQSVQASAYSMLGFYGFLPPNEAYPKAMAGALRTLELDERLPEAHTSLALTQLFYEWDWVGGDRSCRRALELNPDNPLALQVHGAYFLSQGRWREAMASAKRACELDPLSASKYFIVGLTHLCIHEFDAAIAQFRQTLELDANAFSALELMTCAYALQGRYEEAIAACQTLSSLPGERAASRTILGLIHALSGDPEKARNILEELKSLLEKDPVALFYSPMVCAALGEFDRAFEFLNKLCVIRFGPLFTVKGLPTLDPLRSDPRYGDLLRRIGLPE